ncbi:MAG: NAD+ synthase, partial [Gammaproteobacteria bacterium]|nr:NAD+ synthase [Gammaproteobacteria bacterium]
MRATVVMAQLNLLVGDIDGNARRIVESAREAWSEFNADLVVFPELSLTGYPPEDLLLRPSLSRRIDRALAQIAEAGIECPIAVGFPQATDEGLFNALTVIDQGRRIATYHKQQLPNYQVFDEQRYFRPGGSPCLVELFGARVAFTIC